MTAMLVKEKLVIVVTIQQLYSSSILFRSHALFLFPSCVPFRPAVFSAESLEQFVLSTGSKCNAFLGNVLYFEMEMMPEDDLSTTIFVLPPSEV